MSLTSEFSEKMSNWGSVNLGRLMAGRIVNGQFAVPVFGQVKVPTPAAVFRASRGVLRVWW